LASSRFISSGAGVPDLVTSGTWTWSSSVTYYACRHSCATHLLGDGYAFPEGTGGGNATGDIPRPTIGIDR
jgi:hypothetical protein